MKYQMSDEAKKIMVEYIHLRKQQPHFANARSIRNALDRARLRQANRIFATASKLQDTLVDINSLSTIDAEDLSSSRIFNNETDSKKI